MVPVCHTTRHHMPRVPIKLHSVTSLWYLCTILHGITCQWYLSFQLHSVTSHWYLFTTWHHMPLIPIYQTAQWCVSNILHGITCLWYLSQSAQCHISVLPVYHTTSHYMPRVPTCQTGQLYMSVVPAYRTQWYHMPGDCYHNIHHRTYIKSQKNSRCVHTQNTQHIISLVAVLIRQSGRYK